MSNEESSYRDDALHIDGDVEPEDIREFVKRRAMNPVEVEGLLVWNFNNHKIDQVALADVADELMYDKYLIPFQVSGAWGYMSHLLPKALSEMELLNYRRGEGRYIPSPNYLRHSSSMVNNTLRVYLSEQLKERYDL